MSDPIANPPQAALAQPSGEGQGGGPSGPEEKITRSELRLTQRALGSCWDVDPIMRRNALVKAHQILVAKASTNREAIAAAKLIMTADLVNIRAVEVAIKANEHENLLTRIQALEGPEGAGRHEEEHRGADPEA